MVAPKHPPSPGPDPRLYAALEALPEHLTGEIIGGHLIVSPRPAVPHAEATSALLTMLKGPFQFGWGGGPGGWWILHEPELHLADEVFAPDLAGWRKSRMPELPHAATIPLAPDWVCEGLSQHTQIFDRETKLPAYAHHGVKHAWLMDPKVHTLEVFRNLRGAFRPVATFKGNVKVKAEPFAAVELDLSLLWLPGVRAGKRRKPKG